MKYSERAKLSNNPTAIRLFNLLEEKKTNLAVSLDVTQKSEFLRLAELLGPEICVLKTHIDIIEDFDQDLILQLADIASRHNFMIFEDRKFADIGNTVKMQYSKGIYHIAEWSSITNAHVVPGPGIIQGLKEIGLPLGNGLLLLAEMSSKGNLATGKYTNAACKMAEEHRDFVIGFITQKKLLQDKSFLNFTPGVKLDLGQDQLGQQYVTPHKAIKENGSDIIIVGRGIYQAKNPREAAEKYRNAAWLAYNDR